MKKTFLLALVICACFTSNAQVASICEQILRFGVFDYYEFKNESNFDYVFKKLVLMDREELEANYRNRTLDADIPIPLAEGFLKLGLGVGDEQERYKRLRELYINNQEINMRYEDKTWLMARTANQDIIAAWEKCVVKPKELELELKGNMKDTFTVTLRYRPTSDLPRDTRILGITSTGVKLIGTKVFRRGASIRRFNTYTQMFARENKGPISIVLDLEGVGNELSMQFPPIPEPLPRYEVKWFRQDESGRPYYKDTDLIGISCNCNTTGEWNLNEKNARIYEVSYSCVGSGCGWSYNPAGGYGISYRISGDGQAFRWFRLWQGVPAAEVYRVFYEKQRGICVSNCDDNQNLFR